MFAGSAVISNPPPSLLGWPEGCTAASASRPLLALVARPAAPGPDEDQDTRPRPPRSLAAVLLAAVGAAALAGLLLLSGGGLLLAFAAYSLGGALVLAAVASHGLLPAAAEGPGQDRLAEAADLRGAALAQARIMTRGYPRRR